jgi:murein DD-endopeptidase MepM/ murein hydrolase activator NlpD
MSLVPRLPSIAALSLGLLAVAVPGLAVPGLVTGRPAEPSVPVRARAAAVPSSALRVGAPGAVVGSGAATAGVEGRRGRWAWPLRPRPEVVHPFVQPSGPYGPGHRGVDLAGAEGQPVLAVDAGTVWHVGVIAGRGTVTLLHASGLRSTYEPVVAVVTKGQVVARGASIGRLELAASHCSPSACLHLGALRGDGYLDPMLLLGGGRVRLLPLGRGGGP